MEHHRYSFFGQKVGLLLDSQSWEKPYLYFKFLRKKNNGEWEKPSLGEGKSLKLNLLELLNILQVLEGKKNSWRTVHRFQEENTSITVQQQNELISIVAGNYYKQFSIAEKILLKKLLSHIVEEKIIHSTSLPQNQLNNQLNYRSKQKTNIQMQKKQKENLKHQSSKQSNQNQFNKQSNQNHNNNFNNNKQWKEEIISQELPYYTNNHNNKKINNPTSKTSINYNSFNTNNNNLQVNTTKSKNISKESENWLMHLEKQGEYRLLSGKIIAQREKAIAFQLLDQTTLWIPRSLIKMDPQYEGIGLWVKEWYLSKKKDKIIPQIELYH